MIHQLSEPVASPDGVPFVAQVWAERHVRWHAWLVFIAADGRILRTGRRAATLRRSALVSWAMRQRPVDVRGSLARALAPSAARRAA